MQGIIVTVVIFSVKVIKKWNSEHHKEEKCSSEPPESANKPKDRDPDGAPESAETPKDQDPDGSSESTETAEDQVEALGPAKRACSLEALPGPVEGAHDSAAAPEAMDVATDPAATPERLVAVVNTLEDASAPVGIPSKPVSAAPELPAVSPGDLERWAEGSGPALRVKHGSISAKA